MVDVLFAESEAASMKFAGNKKVVCLGFMLDVGDIKEQLDSQYRKNLIYSVYRQDEPHKNSTLQKEIDDEYKKKGDHFIEQGKITVVEDSEIKYARTIARHNV